MADQIQLWQKKSIFIMEKNGGIFEDEGFIQDFEILQIEKYFIS